MKITGKKRGILKLILLIIFLIDIFIFYSNYDFLILIFMIICFFSFPIFAIESKWSIYIGLSLLGLCLFFLIINKTIISEKFSIWAFVFLVIGNFQLLINGLKRKKINEKN